MMGEIVGSSAILSTPAHMPKKFAQYEPYGCFCEIELALPKEELENRSLVDRSTIETTAIAAIWSVDASDDSIYFLSAAPGRN